MNLDTLMAQMYAALGAAGYTLPQMPCSICGLMHSGACPQANNPSVPALSVIASRENIIVDGVGYDGRRKPPMIEADDAGWRYL